MASFKAKLLINEEERTLLNAQQSFNQIADITGRPDGKPYGEALLLSLESTIDDSFFYHHMFDHTQMISGEIIFYKRDGFSVLYKIEFANAYILGLEESFDAYGEMPLHFTIKIGWGIAKINGIVHEEDWNVYNPYQEAGEVTVIEEKEPEFIEYYITDLDENNMDTVTPGETVLLHVITKKFQGYELTLSLNNPTADYIYNGNILENDTLKGYEIHQDHEKIELKIIAQGATRS